MTSRAGREDRSRGVNVPRAMGRWWAARATLGRAGALALTGVLIGAIVAVVVLLSGGGSDSAAEVIVQRTPTATAVAGPTETAEPTAEPSATAEPEAEATAEPEATATGEAGPAQVTSIRDLVDRYGDPVDATMARLRIPAIGVDAAVGARTVGADGEMTLPHGPADIVWYDMSQWTGLGGTIGGGGNAIFAGHVDYNAPVSYAGELGFADRVPFRGGGVLIALSTLSPGDTIEIDFQGETLRYVVAWRQRVSATDQPRWNEIWSADVAVDSITLVTCGGEFNFTERSYVDRWVIRAERV